MSDDKLEHLNLIDLKVASTKEYNLEDPSIDKYFKLSDTEWTVDFVGVILKNSDKSKKIIRSFPKEYFQNNLENKKTSKEDIEILESTLINMCKFDNESFNLGDINNFPVKEYLYICGYFKKYGLYHKDVTKYYKGYGGQIDWKRTVTGSDKILNNNNLLFLPFVNKKIEYEDVFITECMNYVLTDAYNSFGQFFNIGIKYKKASDNKIFYYNRAKLIKKLVTIKRSHFKNIEIKLIDNIIEYIKWKSLASEDVVIVTKKFERLWDIMVKEYLNKFFNYDFTEGKIYFDKKEAGEYNKFIKFSKTENQYSSKKIIDEDHKTKNYLFVDDKQKTAILLEIKASKALEGVNKKVINNRANSFDILKQYLKKQDKENYKIILVFVLPSFESKIIAYESCDAKIAVEEVTIYECYLKVKDVMKYYGLKK